MPPKRCQFCDEIHPEGALFCPNTGEKLEQPKSCCIQCGAPVEADWFACPECGALQGQPTEKVEQAWATQVLPEKKKVRWPYWVGGALLVLALGITALYLFLGLHRKNQIAEIIPEDTALVLSLNPSLFQMYQVYQNPEVLMDTGAVFAAIPGMVEVGTALEDSLPASIDIDFQRDILPWIGAEASLAVFYDDIYAKLDGPGTFESHAEAKLVQAAAYSGPQMMGTIATRNQAASIDFLKRLRLQLERQDFELEQRTYREVAITELVSEPDFPLAFATFHHLVVVATDIDLLMDAIDTSLDHKPVLAERDSYRQTLNELRGNRLGYFFINWQQLVETTRELSSLGSAPLGNLDAIQNLGIAFAVEDQGLRFDYAIQYDLTKLTPAQVAAYQQSPSNQNISKVTPGDSLLYSSGQDMSLVWRSFKEMGGSSEDLGLDFELPSTSDFDEIEREIESQTGVDLTEEIFNQMTGEYALVVIPDNGGLFGDEEAPLGILFYTEVEDREGVEQRLNDLIETIAREVGVNVIQDEFNNTPVWHLEDRSGDIEVGYGFIDNTLFIGSSRYALRMAAGSSASPLSRSNIYQNSVGSLPRSRGVFYLNAAETIDLIYRQLSTYEKVKFDSEIRPYLEPIQAVSISSGRMEHEDWLHGTVFILVRE